MFGDKHWRRGYIQKQTGKTQFTLGGGWNKYDGKHYGIIKWAQVGVPQNHHYYDLTAFASHIPNIDFHCSKN